ncbi:hypothetical protein PybrP1_000144 [[Pythium] brassicae (nom. inval.)]|nr:hypothetical protein PybrP1_000144 [[Pythium] brassicae (nom. inval.)]
MDKAAFGGHLDILQWLHTNRADACSPAALENDAKNGHLEGVKWLVANRTEGCTARTVGLAAENGHLEVVKYLHAHTSTRGNSPETLRGAVAGHHLDIVQWLLENRREECAMARGILDLAARMGHLGVLLCLHAHGLEGCTPSAMDSAASRGYLEVVQWLHANRTEGCTTLAMDLAAASGHLAVVQWLHANRREGCTTSATDYAKSVPMLAWLREHRAEGCSPDATLYAARNGNFAKLLFLRTKYVADFDNDDLAADTLSNANSEIFQWLRANARISAPRLQDDTFTNEWAAKQHVMFAQFEAGVNRACEEARQRQRSGTNAM